MSLLIQKTQLEHDLTSKDESVIKCAEVAHHFAVILNDENKQFWALPTDRLIAVMNYDVHTTLSTFKANTVIGNALNETLEQLNLPQFPHRAPVVFGRNDIVFNGTVFEYIGPPNIVE